MAEDLKTFNSSNSARKENRPQPRSFSAEINQSKSTSQNQSTEKTSTEPTLSYRRVKKKDEEKKQEDAKTQQATTTLNYHRIGKNTTNDDKQIKKDLPPKKRLTKKALISIIVASIGISIVAGLSVFFAFYFIVRKIELPQDYAVVVKNFNNSTYIEAPKLDEAKYYFFEITPVGEQTAIFVSEKNAIDVSAFMNRRTSFSIKVAVQGEDEKSKSNLSNPIIHISKERLLAPVISFNPITEMLEWDYSLGATEYYLYYTSGDITNMLFIESTPSQNNRGSVRPNLSRGIYNVCLIAASIDPTYIESFASNQILITLTEKMETLPSDELNYSSYSITNQTLTINATGSSATSFKILIGTDEFTFTPTAILNTYTIDFTALNYTITVGKQVKISAKGDGLYLLDSDFVDAVSV